MGRKRLHRGSVTIAGVRHRKAFQNAELLRAWLKVMRLRKVHEEAGAPPPEGMAEGVRYRAVVPQLRAHYEAGVERVYSERTLVNYRVELTRIALDWGPRMVARTRIADVDAWTIALRGEGLSTSTIRHLLGRLHACHAFAVRRGWLARIPCPVQRPKLVVLSPGRDIPEEDVLRVLKLARAVWDRRCELILLLARDAGLRRSDMLILRGEDVDLERGWITPRVRSERDAPKSRRPRQVPILTDRLQRALEGAPLVPGIPVLQLSESGIQHMASRAWTEVFPGEGAPLHHLRHTFATRALEAGFSLPTVQSWMGHSSPQTTSLYTHPDPGNAPPAARQAFQAATQGPAGGHVKRGTSPKALKT